MGIKSICGKWTLIPSKSGIPRQGFYGFTHDTEGARSTRPA